MFCSKSGRWYSVSRWAMQQETSIPVTVFPEPEVPPGIQREGTLYHLFIRQEHCSSHSSAAVHFVATLIDFGALHLTSFFSSVLSRILFHSL